MKIQGIVTSSGISCGSIKNFRKHKVDVSYVKVDAVDETLKALDDALATSVNQLHDIARVTKERIGEKESRIFEAHALMLEDPEFIETIQEFIKEEQACIPYAVEKTRATFEQMFLSMDNDYMRERAADINDISGRVIKNALGISDELILEENTVILCEDLEPSDTASLDPSLIAGILTEKGGKTSHSAIIAKSLGIPSVSNITSPIADGTKVIVDAIDGVIIVDPTDEDLAAFETKQQAFADNQSVYEKARHTIATTCDGKCVEVAANIAKVEGLEKVIEQGADGVGLFRTEFLYMNRQSAPDLNEQYNAYKTALEAFGDKPMVIRTFDIGGDKQIDYLNLDPEMNPFLGYRAIRISLDRHDLFKVQLKALIMASIHGNLKIMFPMISCIDEIKAVRALIDEVKAECDAEGTPYADFEIGMMVEIPAVAVQAKQFAKYVDFFSIGTNDLLQYTVAVDRMNERLTGLYTWYHPGLLHLIEMVASAAKAAGIWVGVCGESAADDLLLPFFVGAGIKELSMSPGKIGEIKYRVKSLKTSDCEAVVEHVISLDTADEVESYLKNIQMQLTSQ